MRPQCMGISTAPFHSWLLVFATFSFGIRSYAGEQEKPADADKGVPVEGTVTYTGPAPKPVPVVEAGEQRQLVEVSPKTKGLKDAVVWLEGVKAPAERPKEKKPAVMDQQNFFFVPHVLAVEAGRAVEFFNSDGANHGVIATAAEGANCFNVLTQPGKGHTHRFVKAKRPVRIGCPVHAGMAGWVFVFDHPYFAVTGADGKFRLPPVPPGDYTLHVHHPSGGMKASEKITVKKGEAPRPRVEFGKDDLKVGD